MNQYKIFAQRVGLIGITNLLISLSGIIFLPILTKNLSIEEYGMWNQLMVTVGIVPSVALLGLPYAMTRFLPALEKREEIQEAFYSIFFVVTVASVATSLLIYIFSNGIANKLFDSNILVVKTLIIILFFECLNNLFFNYFRATQQIKKYSILLSIQTLLNIVLVSFFVITGRGIFGAFLGFMLKGAVIFLITFLLIISEVGFKIPRFLNMKKSLRFSLPTIPGNLSSWIVDSSDRYVIGILLGTAFVGLYSPGYTLGTMINMFFAPLTFILPSALSKYYDNGNFEEVRTILSYATKYFILIAIPSAFGLSMLSKPILMILTTPEIATQGCLITPFTALSSLLFGVYGIISNVYVLEKRTKIISKIWLLSSILNLTLNFVFVPKMGILGAAVTTLIAFLFSFAVTWKYCSKSSMFDIKAEFIMKCVIASLLMSLIIIEMKPDGLYGIIITIGICAAFYAIIMFLFKGFEEKELDFFKSMIKNQ